MNPYDSDEWTDPSFNPASIDLYYDLYYNDPLYPTLPQQPIINYEPYDLDSNYNTLVDPFNPILTQQPITIHDPFRDIPSIQDQYFDYPEIDYSQHIDDESWDEKIPCQLCGKMIVRKNMYKHKPLCTIPKSKCPRCGAYVRGLRDHQKRNVSCRQLS